MAVFALVASACIDACFGKGIPAWAPLAHLVATNGFAQQAGPLLRCDPSPETIAAHAREGNRVTIETVSYIRQ